MRLRNRLVVVIAAALFAGLLAGLVAVAPANADTKLSPGNFTGFGFDKCETPSQAQMDKWLTASKYWAVGVYISGAMRACSDQPNLTPTWISTQTANGWKVLPLTVGPQASCYFSSNPGLAYRISPNLTDHYSTARSQGRKAARQAVAAAKKLGIAKGSTLWYDIEWFDISKNRCRISALNFLSAWTWKLHSLGWSSGVYSSASAAIFALDQSRIYQPGKFHMPDYLWIAAWNGKANVNISSNYLQSTAWMPHGRMHQYLGGHKETHGGTSLVIDSNFLDLGRGSIPLRKVGHCHGTNLNFASYPQLAPRDHGALVKAAQCLLKEQGYFPKKLKLTGFDGPATQKAVKRFRIDRGFPAGIKLKPRHWANLLSHGKMRLAKFGSYGDMVRRLQRALNAVNDTALPITGTFARDTQAAVRSYQAGLGMPKTGVVTQDIWDALIAGEMPTLAPSPSPSPSPTPTASPTSSSTATASTSPSPSASAS